MFLYKIVFLYGLKRHNEVAYIGAGALLDQYSRLCLATAARGTFLSISTPLQTYASVMAELLLYGRLLLTPFLLVFSNHRRRACVTEENLARILRKVFARRDGRRAWALTV